MLLDWRAIFGAVAIVGLGWLAGDWSARKTDLRMREELLREAIQVADMISPEVARALTFTRADAGTAAFEEIRARMAAFAGLVPRRSIYSMAIRQGEIVFGPETLDEDDPMSSQPGEVYQQPSPGDWEVLRSGRAFVDGPVTDEYGTFITAVAPVFDPERGGVLMAVGVDIVADEWRARLDAARRPPIIGAGIAALVLLGGMALIRWRTGFPRTGEGRRGHLESALVATLGLLVTAGMFWEAERLKREQWADLFRIEAAEQAGSLRAEFTRYLALVDSIRRFFECSQDVDAGEFRSFVQPMMRETTCRSLLWAARVPAAGRGDTYPVMHAEPRGESGAAIGSDLASDPARLAALSRACDTGRPAAIARPRPTAEGAESTLQLIAPVHDRDRPAATVAQRREGLEGFIVATIDTGDVVNRALRKAMPRGLALKVSELVADGGARALFARAGFPEDPDARFHHTLDFPFADRAFRITCVPTPEFFADPAKQARLWIILPLGVVLALLAAGYMHGVISSRARAEEEKFEMERRLLHAQKLESLGVLAGGIAHDFNNLLMAIQGNLDMAGADLPAGSPARSSVDQAMLATGRATQLTRQMLAYAGKGKAVISPLNIGELVAENARMLRAAIAKNVALDLHIDESVPPVLADPSQIQQVVMNLITNAAEAIGDGPGTVSIATGARECDPSYLNRSRIAKRPAPGRFAMIRVTDTGCGMGRETLEQLFDPFYTTKLKGRGLGMSAVLGIVQAHDGAIIVESAMGRGTSIEVLLPVSAEASDHRDERAPAAGVAPASSEARRGTILVVDDEDAVRNLCAAMVERCGFRTIRAANGKEAVEIFAAQGREIACVVLDIVMPQMDGVATFGALRRIRPDIPVIRCSGFNEEETARHFEGQDFTEFIQKPFHLVTLKEALERMLAGPRP